jgi:hypothetical protein
MNPAELAQQRINYVRVTNGLNFPFTDRHDGVPVTIMPGKSENLPVDMAAHFFGYSPGVERETMFRYICKRQGWNTPAHVQQNPETHKTLAREYFDQLKIEPVAYKLVPADEPDPRKPVPADPAIPGADDDAATNERRGPGRPRKQAEASA